jgi:hypothetical protein
MQRALNMNETSHQLLPCLSAVLVAVLFAGCGDGLIDPPSPSVSQSAAPTHEDLFAAR